MNKDEMKEKAQELTIKNVTDGKSKYFSYGYYKGCLAGLEYNNKQIAELEKENAELKEIIDNDVDKKIYVQLAEKAELADVQKEQLAKAKEIIKDYMIIVKGGNITVCSVPEENRCINVLKLNEQAAQFLKDSEVEK